MLVTQPSASSGTGCEIRTIDKYQYGTYEWDFRAASTSATLGGAGAASSGQISSGFIFNQDNGTTAPNYTELDVPEFEGIGGCGGASGCKNNAVFTNWICNTVGSSSCEHSLTSVLSNPDQSVHAFKVDWEPGSAQYFIDGSSVGTITQTVPSNPAYALISSYPTNSISFGGPANVGVSRWMYVNNFQFVPASSIAAECGPCWKWTHDAGTPGTSTGNSFPSTVITHDGLSREFDITSGGFGGERFSNYFGSGNLDATANHWIYDTWIYFPPSNLDHISNIEMDINNTRPDGTTNIIGLQANFPNGTWDYTIATSPTTSAWVHSNATVTKVGWPTGQWNHVSLTSHNAGSLTCYDSITFNGVTQNLTQGCVNANFSIGFVPLGLIQINYQLDGDGTSFSATSYLDQTSVTHWETR